MVTPRSRARTELSASVVAVAFLVVAAGPNMPIPLLPYYGQTLGLGAPELAVVFSSYFMLLVPALLLMSRPGAQRWPKPMLAVALAFAVLADAVLATGAAPLLVLGRMMSALSVAIGTGAAASLALALKGERGRTLTATGTFLGALAGMTVAALIAEFGPAPALLGYVTHGTLACVTLVLASILLPSVHSAPEVRPAAPTTRATGRGGSMPYWVGLVMGMIAWAGGAVVVGLVPILARDAFGATSLLLASSCAITMLVVGSVTQYLLMGASVRRTGTISLVSFGCGLILLAVAGLTGLVPLLFVSAAILGFGQGPLYRTGLRIATAGLGLHRQGGRASLYASCAFGAAAVYSVTVGVVASAVGAGPGLALACVGLTVPAIIVLARSLRWRAPLRRVS